MSFYQAIIGYVCQNRQCGYTNKTPFKSCPNCGQVGPKPFYDFYKVLGIDRSFAPSELTKAYKKLSLKYHPDLNPQGKPDFLVVSEAYEVLKNKSSQNRYDQLLDRRRRAEEGGFGQQRDPYQEEFYSRTYTYQDFEDIFREFHRYRNDYRHRLRRASQISGALGAILGLLIGFLIRPTIFPLPGLLAGYFLGRLNPGLAPALIKIVNVIAVGTSLFFGFLLLRLGNIPLVGLVAISLYLYLTASRNWEKELAGYRTNK